MAMTENDERGRIAQQYWIERASAHDGAIAVHPFSRWRGYQMWTRHMVQTWTLARIRAVKARYTRCLDVGCGFGDWTELFAHVADEVHAIDVAPAFVEQTKRRVPSAHVTCADLGTFEMPAQLDLVYLGAVMLYLDDADALEVLQRIRAAVVPGALVLWRDWCACNAGWRSVNMRSDFFSIHRRPRELAQLAELARFRVVEVRSSPSIYGEVIGGRRWQWPLRALSRIASLPVMRASHTLILRA